MPIGAIIGGVAGLAGSLISSGSNNKAINTATNAELQAQRENNALQAQVRNQNTALQQPFVNTGYAANANINALLGLGGTGAPVVGGTVTAQPNALTPQQGFQNFQNSTGYQFRVGQGSNALNASFAARGLGNSGASAKAAQTFGQNIASDEFGNYMGYLGNQQQVGVGAANALSGVNTTYGNNTSINNNTASAAIANGAYNKAQNTGALWSNIAGIGANALGAWSSYR